MEDGPGGDGVSVGNALAIRWIGVEREPVEGRASATLLAEFLPKAEHRGAPGILHGGIAATVLDETMAGLSHALDHRASVTATLELRYRRPVPLDGRPLRLEAWRDRAEARRSQRVRGRLLLADGTVAVEGTGIFVQSGPLPGPS